MALKYVHVHRHHGDDALKNIFQGSYKIKKKELIKKKGEKSGLRNVNPDSSPGKNTNEDDDSSDVTGTRSYKEGENDDTKT